MTTLSPPTAEPIAARRAPAARVYKRTITERIEAFISRLSTRNNFWHRVCSLIWLPYAFNSGIRMRRLDGHTFTAVLPFRRFNKNWYNAMAGASLLANSEIAGGMFLFARVGEGYTVVCKELTYKFLRPCLGPALYKVEPLQGIEELIASGKEFNIEVDLTVYQQRLLPSGRKKAARLDPLPAAESPPGVDIPPTAARTERDIRVGRVRAIFHVTPKPQHKERAARRG